MRPARVRGLGAENVVLVHASPRVRDLTLGLISVHLLNSLIFILHDAGNVQTTGTDKNPNDSAWRSFILPWRPVAPDREGEYYL